MLSTLGHFIVDGPLGRASNQLVNGNLFARFYGRETITLVLVAGSIRSSR